MHPLSRIFKSYLMLLLLTGMLAYSLFFLFEWAWSDFRTGKFTADFYFWGMILHTPWWMLGLFVSDRIFKIRIPKKFTFILEVLLFMILVIPVVSSPPLQLLDYLFFPYGVIDFFLCLALLLKLRMRVLNKN